MPELKVGIDVSPLEQTAAGTARYITGLTAELESRLDVDLRRYKLAGNGRLATVVRDTAWYLAGLPVAAARDAVDLLHCPTFRAPFYSPAPLVVTIHDLAVFRHPRAFNRWTRMYSHRVVPQVARRARRIITDSSFTASEVVTLLQVPAAKITVVPLGVGEPFTPDGDAAEGEYVLAVSTLEPRKNLERLVEGFRRAPLDEVELRVVGASGWGDVRVEGERVRRLGRVPDEELGRLYRGARAVAYVSLYEGFGLPVLEAMACGAPVVAADIPSLRELVAGAAILVDPLDPNSIASGLAAAVERRPELRAAGIARARAFSWARTAEETLQAYREAAE